MKNKEIEVLKLKIADLSEYKEKYEQISQVKVHKQETQLIELSKTLEKQCIKHAEMMSAVNSDKDVLI